MTLLKIITLALATSVLVEARLYQKRETKGNVCDPVYNNTNNVQCYCVRDNRDPGILKSADCYLISEDVSPDHDVWNLFKDLKNTNKLTFTNTRGITLKYIPTQAFAQTTGLLKLDIKYGNIERVEPYALANMSAIEEISLRDNHIKILDTHAFAHLRDVTTISLDTNIIIEINRNVFVDLPSLEKLFLTGNKITTIHDRAFIDLTNLRELEIDRNGLFSLNSETFSGLKKLQRLDLSSNSLEVIGDNTFLPLMNLRSLNLEGNKLQMLDDRAFNGLSKLYTLSLARNKLIDIDNVKVFEGLESLTLLSLRGNMIRVLKTEVMAPILSNFYGNSSSLDVEDNNFPCDCRLDWFISLMNKTQNQHLKLAIENLKCVPDAKLREIWSKLEDTDKNGGQVFEDEESQVQNNDYEYYDDTQLNGKLFYIDVRDLINCTTASKRTSPPVITAVPGGTTLTTTESLYTTKVTSSPMSTQRIMIPKDYVKTTVSNRGLLDLFLDETTAKTTETSQSSSNSVMNNEIDDNEFTTIRLVTVSPKPTENKNIYDDKDMASDEAKPDKIKAHRSIQDLSTDAPSLKASNAHRNVAHATLVASVILSIRQHL